MKGLSEAEIFDIIDRHGSIGRHKFKWSNTNINKKLRRMVREGKLNVIENTRDFARYARKFTKEGF